MARRCAENSLGGSANPGRRKKMGKLRCTRSFAARRLLTRRYEGGKRRGRSRDRPLSQLLRVDHLVRRGNQGDFGNDLLHKNGLVVHVSLLKGLSDWLSIVDVWMSPPVHNSNVTSPPPCQSTARTGRKRGVAFLEKTVWLGRQTYAAEDGGGVEKDGAAQAERPRIDLARVDHLVRRGDQGDFGDDLLHKNRLVVHVLPQLATGCQIAGCRQAPGSQFQSSTGRLGSDGLLSERRLEA
jgi:hypothetical protein